MGELLETTLAWIGLYHVVRWAARRWPRLRFERRDQSEQA